MKHIYSKKIPQTQAWWDWASNQLSGALIPDLSIREIVSKLTNPGEFLRVDLEDMRADAFMAWAAACPHWPDIVAVGVQPVYALDPTFEEYLSDGDSLLDILRHGVGGKNPDRVWIAAGLDGPKYTFEDPGVAGIGGAVIPFHALIDERAIFTAKKDEVIAFLSLLGFPRENAERIVSKYDMRP
jgi:hypothetical protein